MEKTNSWRLYHLLGAKILLALYFLVPQNSYAQVNAMEFDSKRQKKPYHFGISFGYNQSRYKFEFSEGLIHHDSIIFAESTRGPGINLAIVTNLKLTDHFSLRALPGLTFAEKDIRFNLIDDSLKSQRVESTYGDLPFQLKFKSEAYKDMRVYALAGVRYSYDFNANAKARNVEYDLKISPHDFSYEYGMGFEFTSPILF